MLGKMGTRRSGTGREARSSKQTGMVVTNDDSVTRTYFFNLFEAKFAIRNHWVLSDARLHLWLMAIFAFLGWLDSVSAWREKL